jgi:cytochrome c oxidase subunit 1
MFISGMNPKLAMPFSVLTILISVPLGMIYLMMYATIRKGSITLTAPMLWALGFIATFLVGGLTGLFLGAAVADIYFHDTYFVVAHFHYTFFPATFFGGFAGITYWFPKMFGRMMNATWSKVHFYLTFIFFNATFWPIFRIGAGGMPRRIADPSQYSNILDQFIGMNQFVSYAAFCLMASQLVFVVNFFYSIFKGPKAEQNPWNATTLEWVAAPAFPGHGNFGAELPVVVNDPYEYSQPGSEKDFIPQTQTSN